MNATSDKLLIIDDEDSSRTAMADYLRRKKFSVMTAADGAEGLENMDGKVSIVITDLKMPGKDGMEVLREVRERFPQTGVIIITAHGDIGSAVEAMRLGASDYLTKPVNPDELLMKIRHLCESQAMRSENAELRRQLGEQYGFEGMIGIAPAMVSLFQRIQAVAPTDSTVLITGSSGSGKELVARALHKHSLRKEKPFVAISGAAIPDSLVESELFGHVKGAFTGAVEKAAGKFETAGGGTLFLDEVAELSLSVQAKLLRVLEERTFSPLGGSTVKKLDARLIFATNKELGALVAAKTFREDLFYRVKGVSICLPPLSERREDIPLLSRHFVKRFAVQHGRPEPDITGNALQHLRQYDWPGNVRELRNCLESVVVLLRGDTITPHDLPPDIMRPAAPSSTSSTGVRPGVSLQDLEREAIEKTLRKFDGNRTKAAESLGLSVRTLQRKLIKLRLGL